eukprot:g1883.t1
MFRRRRRSAEKTDEQSTSNENSNDGVSRVGRRGQRSEGKDDGGSDAVGRSKPLNSWGESSASQMREALTSRNRGTPQKKNNHFGTTTSSSSMDEQKSSSSSRGGASSSNRKESAHFSSATTEIISLIPDLDSGSQTDDIRNVVADAPMQAEQEVKSIKELDREIQHTSYSQGRGTISGRKVDLSLLTASLTARHKLDEPDEVWIPEQMLESIKQVITKETAFASKKYSSAR